MRRRVAHGLFLVFSLSIVLRPFHFVWIHHWHHKHYATHVLIEHHDDCPLEKNGPVEGIVRPVNVNPGIIVSFYSYIETYDDFDNVLFFDFTRLRAPPV